MARDLAERVAANRTNGGNGTAVAPTSQSMEQRIRSMESQFALAMPRGVEAGQLIRDSITAIRRTPKLAECEWRSVVGGLMTCAQLGLRPGVLGHAWLLPFWSSKNSRFEAQLIIGYQGYVELAHRSGKIASTIARTVYANDEFTVDYGLADDLVHKPKLNGDRGEAIAYYAIGKTTTGGHSFVVVGRDDMIKHRDQFAMARNKQGQVVGPWRDNFDQMANKTAFLQAVKWLPKSTDLATAIAVDGSVRLDVLPDSDPAQVSEYIEGEFTEGGAADAGDAATPAAGEAAQEQPTGGTTETGDLIDGQQVRQVNAALSNGGYRKLAERVAFLREVTGRGDDLEATRDLTTAQAAGVLERLEQNARGETTQDGASTSGSATSDEGAEPDTLPVDDDRSRLLTAIGKAANGLGLSIEDVQRRVARDYRTDLDTADLADLSDLLENLQAGAQ